MKPNSNKISEKWRARVEIQIPFHDVDVMEIAWHGHYTKYFEIARCALLDKIKYNYPQMRESGYAWPVIELKIRYIKPLIFKQWIVIYAEVSEYENRLKINYTVYDKDSDKRLTRGHTVQVAVEMKSGEMCFVSPPLLLKKLGI
ncbi:acyl-CoA thioesterase [Microbulbifer spongiae]|uniref:Acyl-CoA thioesterase n=1 Tax=Microbulbifer spongiae TaxID=2944933 RepID=A0ABY9ECD1_9GAMM|nr:thioesterase family protein [Microbulbifer sp. MI-G]WKD49937.1 acyl-CoA thioesterase [Microbulbifer sp. MI-G]